MSTPETPGDRIEITLTIERHDGPPLRVLAQCYPGRSSAWWSYNVERGGQIVDTGFIRDDRVPTDPLDAVDIVAPAIVAHARRADL